MARVLEVESFAVFLVETCGINVYHKFLLLHSFLNTCRLVVLQKYTSDNDTRFVRFWCDINFNLLATHGHRVA
jgi:hypothetical protein